jgi:molecular chaperone HtpG
VDASELRPTASREALYEDSLLESVREALGDQLRGWLVRLAATDPHRLGEFLAVHRLGVKALALHDDEMLRLVDQWVPMETNVGPMTLADFVAPRRDRYSVDRSVPPAGAVAAAQDIALINGGYTYDADGSSDSRAHRLAIVVERLDRATWQPDSVADQAVDLGTRPFLSAQRPWIGWLW